MTAQALMTSHAQAHAHRAETTIAAQPASDILIEKVALSLLAWSARRAQKNQLKHERMALMLDNQRSATQGGSSLGR